LFIVPWLQKSTRLKADGRENVAKRPLEESESESAPRLSSNRNRRIVSFFKVVVKCLPFYAYSYHSQLWGATRCSRQKKKNQSINQKTIWKFQKKSI